MKFTGEVTHLSQKGLGVVKSEEENISYFVFGTWPGDLGEFEVIDRPLHNKKYGYARLVRLIKPSDQRQPPACAFLGISEDACSGCPWMIANYESQLEQKRNRLIYAMKRIGFDMEQWNIPPVHPSPFLYGYRNRFQVKTDGEKLGFVAEGSHKIAPVKDCIVLSDTCRKLLQGILRSLPREEWVPGTGYDWNFIDIDDDLPAENIQLNQKRPFKQGNNAQNEWIKSWLRSKLNETPRVGKVIELFCGSGNFTEVIAESECSEIIAYEVGIDAIKQLHIKNLPKVDARPVDLFKPFIWKILRKSIADADTLVLDPPRAGLKNMKGFFEHFVSLKTIYYISCDPETFARDAWSFSKKGWSVAEIQLVDLFPHTPHVETLAILRK
ncbi:class I SAM-dependent RNA methyltransferase [Nitrosomonas communis]|uniref:23S rRNA (Uracil1939-C5)-methyltransferase n=1 Tax=Nitrosomonas communis TaxID=44574 RepID=A0A1H2QMI4_9PROT|nr:class I SAM-dependent RNA methyltransferase [Nitrosomonas communis]SDW08098.1 23S rRNA (uracil1939-C5)-methyltransferase [Nitrosomonas communis]